ncbi:hypothetical protein VdG1_04359, partial [Verticillium dahliae VDG1]
ALDPETSQLLPARKRRHRVRIQGKLALVRSISTANLSGKAAAQASGRAGGSLEGKRSGEDEELSQTSDTEEEAREVAVRDQQLRGYGIGGAGNIREAADGGVWTVEAIGRVFDEWCGPGTEEFAASDRAHGGP